MKRKGHNIKAAVAAAIAVIMLATALASAENDPGHDTLYIEEIGNQSLTGTLNITDNVSIEGGLGTLQGLLLYGDGTLPAAGNPYIGVSGDDMYLYAADRLILKNPSGGEAVYIGLTANAVDLNVSGALYMQGTLYGQHTNTSYLTVSSMTDGSCDVKAYTNGTLYCGTDATTGGGAVEGSGNSGIVALWNGTSSINNSIIYQTSTNDIVLGGADSNNYDLFIEGGGSG
ncbi:hypothetical protein JW711_02960, partial [Candidatus Woesearchaeota archaeon]|nr:hypothetical protein [Candidatus Woesearchaeota archaeon]